MKLSDLELSNQLFGVRMTPDQPLRKLIRAQDTASKRRELIRSLKRNNNPDNRLEPDAKSGGGIDDRGSAGMSL